MLLLLLACGRTPPTDATIRACTAGVAPACDTVGVALANPRVLALGCAGGSVDACDHLLAAGTDEPARYSGIRTTLNGTPNAARVLRARSASSPLRAYADWEAACFRNDADACAEALTLYRTGATGSYDGGRADGLAALGCTHGRTDLCPKGDLPVSVGRPTADLSVAVTEAEAECAAGWGYGCRAVAEASLAGARDRGALTRDAAWSAALEAARHAYEAACTAGDAYACLVVDGFGCGSDDPVGCLISGS